MKTRCADTRTNVLAPFPTRVISRAANRHPADVHQFKFSLLHHPHFIRRLEPLQDDRDFVFCFLVFHHCHAESGPTTVPVTKARNPIVNGSTGPWALGQITAVATKIGTNTIAPSKTPPSTAKTINRPTGFRSLGRSNPRATAIRSIIISSNCRSIRLVRRRVRREGAGPRDRSRPGV